MGKKGGLTGLRKRGRRSRNRHTEVSPSDLDALYSDENAFRVPPEVPESLNNYVGEDCLEDTLSSARHCAETCEGHHYTRFVSSGELSDPERAVEEEFADEEDDEQHTEGEGGEGELLSLEGAQALVASESMVTGDVDVLSSESAGIVLDNWRSLWAFILTTGSRKLTKGQYQSVRNLAYGFAAMNPTSWKVGASAPDFEDNTSQKISVLPHYSTLRKKYKPIVLEELAPRAIEHTELVDESKAGARCESRAENGAGQITVRTILPSEYARADMATPAVWSEMKSMSLSSASSLRGGRPAVPSRDCIDVVPIVRARRWFYGPQQAMSVESGEQSRDRSGYDFAEAEDIVRVDLMCENSVEEAVFRSFGACNTPNESTSLRGVFAHSWTVHASKRELDMSFTEEYAYEVHPRDREISAALNFLTYKSPTDTVSVEIPPPPVPHIAELRDEDMEVSRMQLPTDVAEAMKRRRTALRERNREMETAWGRWEKPYLKPGDFVVLLRPCNVRENSTSTLLTAVDKRARICVVHRFWTERQERSRHVIFVPGGADIGSDPSVFRQYCPSLHQLFGTLIHNPDQKYAHVRAVRLEKPHAGLRGPEKHVPVSSIGILENGDPYFIYRIVLFWDGFNIQRGNCASGEGMYLICLNLPVPARTSSNAVRILSLTPPGVRSTTVLRCILRDVVEGATKGFIDYDADGIRRRIFVDLVGVLGDTPALNGALDVLGHTSTACCHLCRFVRLRKTAVSSRYGNSVGDGAQSAMRRGLWQHAALHDCGAQRETCRLMGMRHNPDIDALPLHAFASAMQEAKGRIATAENGYPVLSHHFDPYKASFIAPDHLLSGHLRDCITLVLKLLPSSKHLKTCESTMMDLLTAVGLPRQNRVIDHSKKTLYTMSMSEIFALGIVAEQSFLRGCVDLNGVQHIHPLSDSCKSSIQLVGSCAGLIAAIWYRPELSRDGQRAVNKFDANHGVSNIMNIRNAVEEHMRKVEMLCSMSDEDKDALDEGRCSHERKSELSKIYRTAVTAIKVLDKPNLHRLREMVVTTLPMVGHISLIGELVLEKAHQRLKRAIKESNNKLTHIQAMKSASLDDWQGRLTLSSPYCFREDDNALLSCYRLLAGREAVGVIQGRLSEHHKTYIRRSLGPKVCIVAELQNQGKSVLSPRSTCESDVSWVLKGPVRRIYANSQPDGNSSSLDKYIYMAFGNDYFICTADSVSTSRFAPETCFKRGDIVEILCYRPDEAHLHFPFLLQSNCSHRYGSSEDSNSASLWCIRHVLHITGIDGRTITGKPEFFLSVQPCVSYTGCTSDRQNGIWNLSIHKFDKYKVDTAGHLSFAEINTSIRKVGVIYCEDCSFLALTRDKGYPPRKG